MCDELTNYPFMRPTGRDREVIRFGNESMTGSQLVNAVLAVASQVAGRARIGVWATPRIETCISVVGALQAGTVVIPINPSIGRSELRHVLADSGPALLLVAQGDAAPAEAGSIPQLSVAADTDGPPRAGRVRLGRGLSAEDPALILYTSGTTGRPKGVVLPRRAIESNLAALADVWAWTPDDVLMHGLPLFHAHGLILGVLGPLYVGCRLIHLGRFSATGVKAGFKDGATMMFGVPTMYHRLVEEMREDDDLRAGFARSRLIISGSAPLPTRVHTAFQALTGQQIRERYGLTETLMNTAVPANEDARLGYVGPALPGVSIRLAFDDDEGGAGSDSEAIGEVYIRGPNVFLEYLNSPVATAEAFADDWFKTGDMGIQSADGWLKILGRRSSDLIKTGGYKVGAGEVESALMERADVLEVAVTGEDDEDLGQRIVAWVVLAEGATADAESLMEFVASDLAPHKRPREIQFLAALPRNDLGKIQKTQLQHLPKTSPVPRRGEA